MGHKAANTVKGRNGEAGITCEVERGRKEREEKGVERLKGNRRKGRREGLRD